MILRGLREKCIKLSIDKHVYERLQSDLFTLGAGSMSRLISCVVKAYCEDSAKLAEIENGFGDSVDKFVNYLLSDDEILFKKSILKLSVGDFSKRRRVFDDKPKVYKWSITKDAYDCLEGDKRSDRAPYSFVNEIIEEFVTFTIAQKEKIVLAQAYAQVKCAICNNEPFEYSSKDGKVYVMHPYRIEADPDLQYTYVIGNAVPKEDYDADTFVPTQDNIRNIRLINLRYNDKHGCWVVPRVKEKIKVDAQAIEQRLKEVSAAFVGEKVYEIKVLLNEWGERTYKAIIHNRPRYISHKTEYVDGFREYTFRCTLFQAAIYFMNFEDSAKIISPPEAVERIRERINATYTVYL